MFSPLEQFEISPLLFIFRIFDFFGVPLTNFSFFSVVFSFFLSGFLLFSIFNPKLIPSARLYIFESFYLFVLDMISSNLGKKGLRYFPLVFFLFFFILSFNLLGLFPYSYTLTSQIVVAATLSFSLFIGLIIIAIVKFKLNFFALFFPSGAPVFLAFLLVPIEIVSVFSRPFSLAIRLFANMTAGHVLLKILAGFTITLFSSLLGLVILVDLSVFGAANSENLGYCFNCFGLDYIMYIDCVVAGIEWDFGVADVNLAFYDSWVEYETNYYTVYLQVLLFQEPLLIESVEDPLISSSPMGVDILITAIYDIIFDSSFDYDSLTVRLLSPFIDFTDFFESDVIPEAEPVEEIEELTCSLTFVDLGALSAELQFNKFNLSLTFFFNLFSAFFTFFFCTISALIPILVLFLFIILELFVAILQAYVFSILAVIYLRDSLELH